MRVVLRAAFALLVAGAGSTADAQVCTESQRCLHTIGSPGRFASMGAHRLLVAHGEVIWPSFIDVFALDLGTGRTRSLPHCGTAVTDIAIEGTYVYVLADRSSLCRVSLTGTASVQSLITTNTLGGFAVSSAAVAYSLRRPGDQPELRVLQWNGQSQAFVTAVTVEHVVVDAQTVYWIDGDYILRASLATGAKTVGPRAANHVTRLRVDHGVVYVATTHEIQRLDSAGTAWVTLAHEGAEDLAVAGTDVYWASAARARLSKLSTAHPNATPMPFAFSTKPFALAIDGPTLFFAEDDPFVIKQIDPR